VRPLRRASHTNKNNDELYGSLSCQRTWALLIALLRWWRGSAPSVRTINKQFTAVCKHRAAPNGVRRLSMTRHVAVSACGTNGKWRTDRLARKLVVRQRQHGHVRTNHRSKCAVGESGDTPEELQHSKKYPWQMCFYISIYIYIWGKDSLYVFKWIRRSRCSTMDSLHVFKCKRFRNTRNTVTVTGTMADKTWCVLLHCGSSKYCTCSLNKFI
jgi:hypothetical protein